MAVALWLPMVGFGLVVLWKYAASPGRASEVSDWPLDAPIRRASDRSTLLMFAHPHCPCSRASVGELAILMTRAQKDVSARVLFYQPKSESAEWVRTDLWRSAAAIPGVEVLADPENAIASRFGAFTSGQTLLFERNGRLMFRGGITAARGHSGDNAGRDAVLALLHGPQAPLQSTPVFGCSLRGE